MKRQKKWKPGARSWRPRKVKDFVSEPLPQLFPEPEFETVVLAKEDITAESAAQLLDQCAGRLKPRETKALFAIAHRLDMPKDAADIDKVVKKLATRTKNEH